MLLAVIQVVRNTAIKFKERLCAPLLRVRWRESHHRVTLLYVTSSPSRFRLSNSFQTSTLNSTSPFFLSQVSNKSNAFFYSSHYWYSSVLLADTLCHCTGSFLCSFCRPLILQSTILRSTVILLKNAMVRILRFLRCLLLKNDLPWISEWNLKGVNCCTLNLK